jgi:hypothetical protein
MYDEHIQNSIRRLGVEPIQIEAEHLDKLIQNFRLSPPNSVILTGTAGDGKTYYCREIWKKLGGSDEEWKKAERLKRLSLGAVTLVVVKDLSELRDEEKKSHIALLADVLNGVVDDTIYLIAANDGQLVDALAEVVRERESIQDVRNEIVDLLFYGLRHSKKYPLDLYNLSRTNSAVLFPRVVQAILKHQGWNECDGCIYKDGDVTRKRCPIWENKARLEDALFQERLTDLLELCELNGQHLPIRQMLLLTANVILGHPDSKEDLMSCREIPQILSRETSSLASPYRNVFGENLSERKRGSQDVFRSLNRFGIGTETNNLIDNTLIFGEDDSTLSDYYRDLIRADQYYGADAIYQSRQREYLEGELTDRRESFLTLLKAQRQQLFFTIPKSLVTEMGLWNLTTFHFAGEYLNEVHRLLDRGGQVRKHILDRLVRGLNRIFTGLLTQNQDELILATSGSHSQARVSRVYEGKISVAPDRGERIFLKSHPELKRPVLIVALSRTLEASLQMNLTRFEYLSRIAEGSLPNSFSRECYEDLLAFKTRVLTQLRIRRHADNEMEDESILSIKLIPELDSDGLVKAPLVLEIQL